MEQKQTIEVLRNKIRKLESRAAYIGEHSIIPVPSPEMESWFPLGGFMRGGITEIRGELGGGGASLIAPVVASESTRNWVAIVDMSGAFYPLGLNEFKLDWSQICLVRPRNAQRLDWTIQQLSRSGLFSLVVIWGGEFRVDARRGRAVLQAAEAGKSAVVYVGTRHPLSAYPCVVRIAIGPLEDGAREVSILRGAGRVGDRKRIKMGAVWDETNVSSAFSSLLFGCKQ